MEFSITIDTEALKKSIDETRDRFNQARAVASNMIASMLKDAVSADVAGAGRFPSDSVTVAVDGDKITTTVDLPGAGVFETGGVIYGKPLLWIPFSGTDAEGIPASSYGEKLFSVNRKTGGVPLLFSVSDKAPKYFGVPNVTVPKKFHIAEIEQRIMAQYAEVFERSLNG